MQRFGHIFVVAIKMENAFVKFLERELELDLKFYPEINEIECDSFELSFYIHETELVIGSISILDSTLIQGNKIIQTIKNYLDESGLDSIRAQGVLPDVKIFWENQGFVPIGKDYIYEKD